MAMWDRRGLSVQLCDASVTHAHKRDSEMMIYVTYSVVGGVVGPHPADRGPQSHVKCVPADLVWICVLDLQVPAPG